MANTVVADHKDIEGWTNERFTVVLEYDFANDGGATATFDLGAFKHKTLVLQGAVFVETVCTSGGSATVAVGTSTADPDAFMDITSGAVAALVDDFVHTETAGTRLVVAANETCILAIATAALTAGKIKVILECIKVA